MFVPWSVDTGLMAPQGERMGAAVLQVSARAPTLPWPGWKRRPVEGSRGRGEARGGVSWAERTLQKSSAGPRWGQWWGVWFSACGAEGGRQGKGCQTCGKKIHF